MIPSGRVRIDYTNWRGERASRLIVPKVGGLRFVSNEWHRTPQWVIEAVDCEKGEDRMFALNGIHSWVPE